MKQILRPPLAVLVAVVMASCARLPDDIPPERTTGSRERLSAYEKLPADRVYRVLPDESVLRVLVGRAGPLAAMGHQHVVTSRDISGAIFVGEAMEDSRADLLIPVRLLRVDEKEERGRAGDGYRSELDEADIQATRRNMLSEEILDGGHHPDIRITLHPLEMNPGRGRFAVAIHIKGREFRLQLSASLSIRQDTLFAASRFTLGHRDLGLQPFSTLGGALRVAESLGFELQIKAKIR